MPSIDHDVSEPGRAGGAVNSDVGTFDVDARTHEWHPVHKRLQVRIG